MKIFIVINEGKIQPQGYTSLVGACKAAGVSYSTASRGKRSFDKQGSSVVINEIQVVKIRGRGK